MLKFLLGWIGGGGGGGGGGGKKYTFSSLFFKLCTLGQNYTSQDVKREVLYICKMIRISKCHEGQYSVRQDAVYLRHTSKRDAVYLLCNLGCSDMGQSKVRLHMACEIIMIA